MYKLESLTIKDVIFLEYSLFLYKQRLEDEIIETNIRIDKATKEDNTDDYKLYAYMLETKQASKARCDYLMSILDESIEGNKKEC